MSGFESSDDPVNKFSSLSLEDKQRGHGKQTKAFFRFRSRKADVKVMRRPVRILPKYEWSKIPRGYCLIINIKEFSSADLDRKGSDEESKRLGALFETMGFQAIFSDKYLTKNEVDESPVKMTARKIHEVLDLVRQDKALKEHHAFILFVMSHGTSGKVKGYDGYSVYINEIIQYFTDHNCPNLMGKPKLFFINACRGENFIRSKSTKLRRLVKADSQTNCSHGVDNNNRGLGGFRGLLRIGRTFVLRVLRVAGLQKSGSPKTLIGMSESSFITASIGDMAIVYSTLDGCTSLRDEIAGSWFGVAIEEVFKKYAKNHEFSDLMRKVDAKVSKRSKVHEQHLPWNLNFRKIFIFGPFPTKNK